MQCPSCGESIQPSWNTCPHCSSPLSINNFAIPSYSPEAKANTFSKLFLIIGVTLAVVTVSLVGLIYYNVEVKMEVVSENSRQIESGDYQIIRIDDASRIEWTVTNHASEWPRYISSNLGNDWPSQIDAIFIHSNDKLYIFSGDKYYRVSEPFSGSEIDFVGEIGVDGWSNVPSNLDGALLHSNGKVYFFKGDKYYRYVDGDVDKVGTIGVDGWEGIPANIDGVLLTSADNVHFFKAEEVWRYQDGQVSYQGKIGDEYWHGIPNHINAVFASNDEYLFFKDSTYYFYYQGAVGGAFAFDIYLLNEENCDNFVNNAPFEYEIDGSKVSIIASSNSGRIDVPEGNYCVILDNSAKGDTSPPNWQRHTDLSLSWIVKAGS